MGKEKLLKNAQTASYSVGSGVDGWEGCGRRDAMSDPTHLRQSWFPIPSTSMFLSQRIQQAARLDSALPPKFLLYSPAS